MSLEKLHSLLPAPPSVEQVGDWIKIEKEYGIQLPDDYKAFIEAYGSGSIDNFLWIFNPFSENKSINFEASTYFGKAYQELKAISPSAHRRPIYPLPGSFFTWAVTDNGDSLFWSIGTNGEIDGVGIHSSDPSDEELFEIGAIELVYRLVAKVERSALLPEAFPSELPQFQQLQD